VWLNYNFSTTVFSRALIQYNSENHEVLMNLRFHWIPKPKSHLYLVYNETLETVPRIQTMDRVFMAKLDYNFTL